MFKLSAIILTVCLFVISDATQMHAQQRNAEYLQAMQHVRQNQYDKAYPILIELHRRDPSNYPVFDQLLNVLTELKRYDEAIELTESRLRNRYNDVIMATRLGEFHHLNGNTERALEIWNRTIAENQNNLQAYRYVGETMRNRREFSQSIELYESAREIFDNQTLFFSELTASYLSVGHRDKAVSVLVGVLDAAPGNRDFVQRQIINMDDPAITELAILELDERSSNAPRQSPQYAAYRELGISLLMERRLFRRALAAARSYESVAQDGRWPVFDLAGRLRAQNQFELALEAYIFYADQRHSLQAPALHEKAILYITWSRYLTTHNLDYDGKARELYVKADETLSKLLQAHPNYSRKSEVLSAKADIALDHLHNPDAAMEYLTQLRNSGGGAQNEIIADYLEGRILMFQGSHSMARIHFTRANRNARTGDWAERSRYFLALNDFYAGDFEFAALQMRPLERQSTSYYANDALRLRLWIREGRIQDEATDELKLFSEARYLFDTGRLEEAVQTVMPLITSSSDVPLRGEAIIMASDYMRTVSPTVTYAMLHRVLTDGFSGAQRERLLWERARIADGLKNSGVDVASTPTPFAVRHLSQWAGEASKPASAQTLNGHAQEDSRFISAEALFELYEDILFDYPMGFYADAIRQRLQEMQTRFNL